MRLLRSVFVCSLVFFTACDCNKPGPGTDGGGSGGNGGSAGAGGGSAGGGAGGGAATGGGFGGNDGGGCGLVTCASSSANCGPIGDGCGAVIDCGTCSIPTTCGGGGVPSQCGGDAGCIPRTCTQIGAECGPMSDGCGGLLNCGACTLPETCGGGGINSRCGLPPANITDGGACVPTTCTVTNAQCGVIGDGCGQVVMCGSCDGGTLCGGGGVPYRCGGGSVCVPKTCGELDAGCGAIGDGCGNILNCGVAMCAPPLTCGGGGVPNQCGGGTPCVARTCAQADAGCGLIGDGCGAVLMPSCGTCMTGQCGAGGVPNQCGGASLCMPRTCAALNVNCGAVGDGCGSIIQCGPCTDGGTCGGAGAANVCGARPACVPRTCAQAGANCGQVSDGCGALTSSCGGCDGGDICGGSGTPSVCGSVPFDGGACVNLCMNQAVCTPTTKTKLLGTVFAPTQADAGYGNPDPIPGALIYVPNSPVLPFRDDAGVTCDQCSDTVSGSPLVSTISGIDGGFVLDNVPCGNGIDVPVVIQLGKWRRQVTMQNLNCCQNNSMTAEQSRLPRRQAEGHPNDNIPLIAVVTGDVDTIECVLPKIGIDRATQYSLPSGNGRVRFYRDNGANFTGGAPAAATLFDSLTEMRKYDMIILDCVGGEQTKTIAQRANMEAYSKLGGRIFASHFAYVWLYGRGVDPGGNNIASPNSFTSTATFNVNQSSPPDQDAFIDFSFPKGDVFAKWIQLLNAQATTSTPANPRIRVLTVRHDMDAVIPPAQRWVYGGICTAATCAQLGYTCGNGLANGCGGTLDCRQGGAGGDGCPNAPTCGGGGVAGQCGSGTACVPKTCAQLNYECGTFANGCGGTITCGALGGSCPGGQICGGAGQAGRCGTPNIPLQYTFNTPTDAGVANQCGRVLFSDFHVINAANANAQTWPGQCTVGPMNAQEKVFEFLLFDLSSCITPDVPPPQMCTPRSCLVQDIQCGQASDGCGTNLNCGGCDAGTCGGGGVPGVCGVPCTPRSCAQLGVACGFQGDGCGGSANPDGGECGVCTPPQTCGGGGTPNQCGGGMCVTKTCAQLGFNCGMQSNGCTGTQDCGMCMAPQTCGGGGVPGVCGGGMTCTPLSCAAQGFNCGAQGDGCGGMQPCGMCTPPMTCGGGGQPGVCGGGMMCTPKSCVMQGFECGLQGDGCGNQIDCGPCPMGQTCGVAGPGRCGSLGCIPLSCAQQGFNCGLAGDGCGALIQCGPCPVGQTCGGGGVNGVCGAPMCTPRTCASAGANCGPLADGCGAQLDCGQCVAPQTCGGGGIANVCGNIG